MERSENMVRYDALMEQLQALKKEYKESQPVKPKQVVLINGQRYYLEKYEIVGYTIDPVLFKVSPRGNPAKCFARQYPDNWMQMVPEKEE